MKTAAFCIFLLLTGLMFSACQKNEIDFGSIPEDYYTTIGFIDTVEASLATVISDSFVTSSAESFLLGVVNDPELGLVNARPFFQLGIPGTGNAIPELANFDSAKFIVRLNKYYYGDSTRSGTIYLNELSQEMVYSYNDKLYNTTNFEIKTSPIGNVNKRMRPAAEDSITIPVNKETGEELFGLLKSKSDIISTQENFLRYFKGVRLSVNASDSGSIVGIKGEAGLNVLRIYYSTKTPYPVDGYVDFPSLANSYAFNQLIADRSGTLLSGSATSGEEIFPSASTANKGYMQSGLGVKLKISFPSLGNILLTDKTIRLQKAELILKPVPQSYDLSRFILPPTLYLAQTNATNTIGYPVADSTGSGVQYVSPVVDLVYGVDTYYQFNITSAMIGLLSSADKSDFGLFLMEQADPAMLQLNRAVFGNRNLANAGAQLRLTLVKINNN